jgi:hypothetical protein
MHHLASALSALLNDHFAALESLPEDEMSHKPSSQKWSKKEIIGHLIDSAQNNIRRFIVAQYEDRPAIVYNQDKWVAISNYQHYNTAELLQLWLLLNKQICRILENTDAETAERLCNTGQPHSIKWLAEDYIAHLKHHLHQVLGLEAIPY